jgi:polar amino acid transport system substrate-binding protein
VNDELLNARLKVIDDGAVPSAVFVEELHGRLAARLGFPGATPDAAQSRPRSESGRYWLLLAATLGLLVALSASFAAGSLIQRRDARLTVAEMLDASGALRIAVRPDDPQVIAPGGALRGFDVDVAEAVADRLGVRAELVILTLDEILGPTGASWQVALPSRSLRGSNDDVYVATDPYYEWPIYVLVQSHSGDDAAMDTLAGATVCAVAGSPGEDWLEPGIEGPSLSVSVAAPSVEVRSLSSDAACLADLAAGNSSAMVSNALLASDISTRADVRILGGTSVAVEPRSMLVSRSVPEADALADVLDEVVEELRADGTLRELANRWFGGEDLTRRVP